MFDLVFKEATVIDGSGAPAYKADVAIEKDRISSISRDGGLKGKEEIDARDSVLSPGFIDFHSHSDWILDSDNQEDILLSYLLQGVTTFVGGNCGFSPYPVNKYKDDLYQNSKFLCPDDFCFNWESQNEFITRINFRGTLLNFVPMVGHGSLRTFIKGNDPSPLTSEEHDQLKSLIIKSKSDGAYGISLGLAYVSGIFADYNELLTVFKTASEQDLLVTIHGRTYSWTSPFFDDSSNESSTPHNVRDVKDFIEFARITGAKINLSHMLLKGRFTWNTYKQIISLIDEAVESNIDVTFGVIPYHWGNTLINTLLPKWYLENFSDNIKDIEKTEKLINEVEQLEKAIGRSSDDIYLLWGGTKSLSVYEGMSFREISKILKLRDMEIVLWIMKESKGKAKILTATYSGEEGKYETPLEQLLKHQKAIVEIDTIITSHEEPQSPAAHGALPKVLGKYCREKGLFSIEEAVYKMTGFPAKRLGIDDIGIVRTGSIADLVLFNPQKIKDQSTMSKPLMPPIGIEQVWLNGNLVLKNGKRVSDRLYGKIY